ncbi:hypothetical protein [uncultured Tateyamaria sp.]|uniref:hypothetical protein n=1 Tax=uncultured Tateyamaria sp. TaxID=455651 RepID=UPI002629BAE5|nr:hypothetical protein [uncultured Tateyamaria sp.]
MPRSVLITTSVLVVLAGMAGFWLGQRQVTLDATGIINAVAARHVAEHGGAVTDCLGWAGEGAHVFRVKCGDVTYHVDRFGAVRVAPEDEL